MYFGNKNALFLDEEDEEEGEFGEMMKPLFLSQCVCSTLCKWILLTIQQTQTIYNPKIHANYIFG